MHDIWRVQHSCCIIGGIFLVKCTHLIKVHYDFLMLFIFPYNHLYRICKNLCISLLKPWCIVLVIYPCLHFKVCDCQHHFARWEDGQQIALPIFGGSQGPEFTQSLLEIESIFHRGLQNLRSSADSVFNVTNTVWFQEFDRLVQALETDSDSEKLHLWC